MRRVYAKAKNVEKATRAPQEAGDVWTWVAIDAESKLIPTWHIGPRDAHAAHAFMTDLAGRLKHRIQLTTDGHRPYLERQNLTMRMSMRRYTRLTNGFSKKLENHAAATAIHFMYYNFARIHRTVRMSPAMAAGVTETLWSIRDIVGLLEEHEVAAAA